MSEGETQADRVLKENIKKKKSKEVLCESTLATIMVALVHNNNIWSRMNTTEIINDET